ncbi:hypothetical protein M3650_04960 [Paenibacillus sp. MER TA 81-3]|uniref:hypothetical protein n=1 Tax=Paenibacillus sp. MER TA 81-3 TaxID=2939573 RepID=UPI00203C35AC|nr:hypothetical protein [Paenibacillus sp. MER TA 81-3]MCM3338003.1 hypothetical protein [Paenibacillus sp. MER TA 81-3]
MSLINELYTYTKANPVFSLIITFIISALVWLYNESKNIIQAENKLERDEINKKLQIYGGLESTISLFIKTKSKESEMKLFEMIGNSAPVVSDKIRNVIVDYFKDYDENRLKLLLVFIELEIKELRQNNTARQSENKSDEIDKFMRKLAKPAKPILFLLFVVCISFFSLYYWLRSDSWFERFNYMCGTFSIVLGALLLFWFLKELITNKLKLQNKYIILLLIISLCPVVAIFINEIFFLMTIVQVVILYATGRIKRNEKKIMKYESFQ